MQKKLSNENDKKTFKNLICEKYSVEKKSIVKQFVAIKIIHMQQDQNEIIKKYYLRNHDVLVAIDDMNIFLFLIIRHWINEFNNKKLSKYIINKSIKEQNLFNVCIIAKRKFRQKQERKQQKKYRLILQQQLQKFVDRDLVDDVSIIQSQKFHEFSFVLKKMSCHLSMICTTMNIMNILFLTKFIVSKFTSSQSSLFEVSFVDEFLFILKKLSLKISKINTDNVNNCDIETIDEILVFNFVKKRVWLKITITKTWIFDLKSKYVHEKSKCLKSIVNVKF